MTTQKPKSIGRPPIQDQKLRRSERYELRLTPSEKTKAKRLGARWFYTQLAKEP